jgi:hypothetical protein
MDDAHEPMSLGDRLAWTGLVLIGILCLSRAMIEHDPFPWWQSDPFVFSPPIIGLTPRWALLFNVLIVLASTLSLLGQHLRGRGFGPVPCVLLMLGFGVLGYHASIDLGRVLDASTIAAVVSVFAAASLANSLPGAQRVLGGVTLSFALLLVGVGMHEVFISHPQTIIAYESNRDSFLSARGWSPESFEAMSYERRLRNPEPIAWFGLTNVFASFCAASGAGLFAVALGCSGRQRLVTLLAGLGACLAIFGLVLSGSKGGFGVLVIGLVLAVGAVRLRDSGTAKRIDGRLIIGLCLLVLLALLLRGILGERLGERSLLFRWQYMVGSISIWLHDPLLGCGPGIFQERYALLKPDLSPEDVASAHNVLFDWLATLGLGGLALIGFVARPLAGIRAGYAKPELEEDAPVRSVIDRETKVALVLIMFPVLISMRMQSAVMDPSQFGPFFAGLALWIVCAMVFVRAGLSASLIQSALICSAGVLAVHAMLEVTATMIVSAPLWALMLGLACSGRAEPRRERVQLLAPLLLIGMAALLLLRWGPINAWERSLHRAADDAVGVAQVRSALDAMEFRADPTGDLSYAQERLSTMLGRPVGMDLDSIIPALNQAEVDARMRSIDLLGQALQARPAHTPTRVALSQQMLWIASVARSSGQDQMVNTMWDDAYGLFADDNLLDAGGRRWAGNILWGRAMAFHDAPDRRRWLELAMTHWIRALELAPHDPQTALRLMEASIELGDESLARVWAQRALELHEMTRLDPLRGLRETDQMLARRIGGT